SVAMAKLGARVVAIDNDPIAVAATASAVQLNNVESQVRVCSGSLGQGSELGHWMNHHSNSTDSFEPAAEFDLIVTNILARVHIALASDYRQALMPQGVVITAGYTIDFADEVDTALVAAGFEQIDREEREEWVAIAHRLR
ncbi:MAG: 50S ribosomal protein L11 methyltransferase, partial [Microcoleus sp. SIO2G3]|nr:50S ribosomal protein L11 methyltransferase [Microcoleus sp. SIO2G3]